MTQVKHSSFPCGNCESRDTKLISRNSYLCSHCGTVSIDWAKEEAVIAEMPAEEYLADLLDSNLQGLEAARLDELPY